MTKDTIYEDIGKEVIKQHVGSQWANVVYKSIGFGYTKLLQTTSGQQLFLTKEERFSLHLANLSIDMLDNLKCAEIVNIVSNNAIFTDQTLRYFYGNNIEIFTWEKLLWLSTRSNIKLGSEKSFGVKDFVAPITFGILTPIIGPAGSGIISRRLSKIDEEEIRNFIFVPIARTSDAVDSFSSSTSELVQSVADSTIQTVEKSAEFAKDVASSTLEKSKDIAYNTYSITKEVATDTSKAAGTKAAASVSVINNAMSKLTDIWGKRNE